MVAGAHAGDRRGFREAISGQGGRSASLSILSEQPTESESVLELLQGCPPHAPKARANGAAARTRILSILLHLADARLDVSHAARDGVGGRRAYQDIEAGAERILGGERPISSVGIPMHVQIWDGRWAVCVQVGRSWIVGVLVICIAADDVDQGGGVGRDVGVVVSATERKGVLISRPI